MNEQISADIVINLLREEISQLKWENTLLRAQTLQAQQEAENNRVEANPDTASEK